MGEAAIVTPDQIAEGRAALEFNYDPSMSEFFCDHGEALLDAAERTQAAEAHGIAVKQACSWRDKHNALKEKARGPALRQAARVLHRRRGERPGSAAMSDPIHCSDGNCVFGHSGGMHTNSGCKCLRGLRHVGERIEVTRRIRALRKENKALRAAAKAYQDFNVCYRLGKQPTEALWKRIEKADELL